MNKTWLIAGALLLSLAANAFFAGLLIGRPTAHSASSMHAQGKGRSSEQGAGQHLQRLMAQVRQLPSEQRRTVAAQVRSYAPQLRELGKANQQAKQAVQQQLLAPQLNRTELEQALAHQRQLQEQIQTLSQRMLVEVAEQLPPQQRAQLWQRADH